MIIVAAREVFSQHGYHGASTAQIAAAAECSEAVLYRHFASKQEILLAVYDSLEEAVGELMASSLSSLGEPADALVELVGLAGRDPELTKMMRNFVLALSMSHEPEVAERLLANFASLRGRMEALVRAAQQAGSLRDDIAPEVVVWMIHGLVVTAGVRNGVRADGVAAGAEEAARTLMDVLRPTSG